MEYWTCGTCRKVYSDAEGRNEIEKDSWVIKAVGHTPGTAVKENEVSATESAPGGYDEVVCCSICGEELSRVHVEIPVLPHDPVITFLANGGEGQMEAQTVTANKKTALNANGFTFGDRVFTGWNTKADGSGAAYTDGQAVTLSGDLTLYAIWGDKDNGIMITDVSIEGASGAKTIPDGAFSLKVGVKLDHTTRPESVQVIVASYKEDGQFLSYTSGTLTKGTDETYISAVDMMNNGDTDCLRVLVLSRDRWIPQADAMELR